MLSSIAANNVTHLLKVLQESPPASKIIDSILLKRQPITVLLEGSSYFVNIDALNTLLSGRKQPKDKIILIEINTSTVLEYRKYIQKRFPNKNYQVVQADMNALPIQNNSIDLVVHNFTVNFNMTNRDDAQTLTEIKRVMRIFQSACLFSVGILGTDDAKELTLRSPSGVAILDHSKTYYKTLFRKKAFYFIEFDQKHEKTNFSYKRYILVHI
ncbi:MAG: methyltransferase domain-containing protein [bacterium]